MNTGKLTVITIIDYYDPQQDRHVSKKVILATHRHVSYDEAQKIVNNWGTGNEEGSPELFFSFTINERIMPERYARAKAMRIAREEE